MLYFTCTLYTLLYISMHMITYLQIGHYFEPKNTDIFVYFSLKTYIVGTH